MKPGDIVLIPVPQVGGRSRKLRPALIVTSLPGPMQDILVCSVRSDISTVVEDWDEIVSPDAEDFAGSGLRAASVIRLSYINALGSSDVRGVIGRIAPERLESLRSRLKRALSAE